MPVRPFSLGRSRSVARNAPDAPAPLELPAHHLVTHGVVLGMTGSGKTGLAMVLVEEALRSRIPVLLVDVKGDLANLFLTFPSLAPADFEPFVDAEAAERDGKTRATAAAELSQRWCDGLASWGLGAPDVAALRANMAPRLITPGSTAGESLHVLSSLTMPASLWIDDEESARDALTASISLVLRLLDRDADPTKSREHVMLSHLAERRLRAGRPAGLPELLADLEAPPIATVGALAVDDFLPPRDRRALAQQLNTLLASPTFAAWQKGASLDLAGWMARANGKVPAVIVSVAHLDDAERQLVLGLLFDQLLSWVRGLAGTSELRALVLFDEVFGFLPPHPANPPTKRPLLALLKQARAFGVGVVVATQNPMDLDYKALSNAGAWFVGRLQTDADRERVVEGLAGSDAGAGLDREALATTLKSLPPRTFFVRDVHQKPSAFLLETRYTLSWLRGPLTRREMTRLTRGTAAPPPPGASAPAQAAPAPAPRALANATPAPAEAPASPEGWETRFAHPPADGSAPTYTPYAAATVVAHVRDAKLGVQRARTLTIAAPLGTDGRPDTARAHELDPRLLANTAAPRAVFAPLPDALSRKSVAQAAERALRDHVRRLYEIILDVHRGLELVRDEGESEEAFAGRCRAEAGKLASLEHQQIVARFAPKLARLEQRVAGAKGRLAAAETELGAMPGAVGTALLGLALGSKRAQRAESTRDRASVRVDKARAEIAEAESELRETAAAQDAELRRLANDVNAAAAGVEKKRLAPKKGDVEVTAVMVAWAVVARGR
jgi:hypothetical protein